MTVALVTASSPRLCRAGGRLYPTALGPRPIARQVGVSPRAHVAATALLEEGVTVEPFAVIGPAAEIGAETMIGPGAVIGPGVRIGREASIGLGAITHALLATGSSSIPACVSARTASVSFPAAPGI